ncbi:hypothetical protein [Winogradskyella sp.]|uniref:hypothetical protein n=1 Tax=Winogradskyella sp. TaxID=1883156 RepID=UPI003BAC5F7F
MSKSHPYALLLGIGICLLSISCEQDNYEVPELKAKTYSFNIPNRISFNFSQLSENRESIVPYSNTLNLKNISNGDFSGKYAVFAFKDMNQNFENISFIKSDMFDPISPNILSDSITLEMSDNLFSDNNLIASIINFNNEALDHNLNGLYTGELNILIPTSDEVSQPTFVRSLTCTGFIDFEGQFRFFIHNTSEDNIVQIRGNFNTSNQVSGHIMDREANNLSSVMNTENDSFSLTDNNLTGVFVFNENNESRHLELNLTKHN